MDLYEEHIKVNYIEPKIEVVSFGYSDVITASSEGCVIDCQIDGTNGDYSMGF